MTAAAMSPRAAWVETLRLAREAAEAIVAGDKPTKFERQQLTAWVADLAKRRIGFPLPWVSAQTAAEAWLLLARGFVAADGLPQTARGVAALAADLQDMLEADTRAAFQHSLKAAGTD